MIRTINAVLVCTGVLSLVAVYALKFSVEDAAGQRFELTRQIERQEGQLSLLKADWAYLNQPGHVAPSVARRADVLGLQIIDQKQIGGFAGLPMRPPKPDNAGLNALFESLDAGVDPADERIGDTQ
jgi:hypothetical protein